MTSGRGRQSIKERREEKRRRQRLSVLLAVSGIALLLIGLAFVPTLWEQLQPVGEIVIPESQPRPMTDFNTVGDPDAPVVIVEFSDFQCPYCKLFADETEPLIIQNHVENGEVYFVYRSLGNFISDNVRRSQTESRDSAEAAYCAGDQGKFWEYKDIVYANWQGEDVGSFTPKRLVAFAEALNLDIDQFQDCFDGAKYRDQVMQDQIDGANAGINSTPSFLINGKLVVGAQPYSVFQQEIQDALAASGE